MRPVVGRPMVARPVMSNVQRPVYVGQSAAPVRVQAPLPLPFPQLNSNAGRLPDIELRTQERRNYKQEFQEMKKPLLKILNSGAKIALQKVLQKASEPKDPTAQKTKGSQVGLEEVINGAEVILRHYLELKNLKNKTGSTPQTRADNFRRASATESNLFSKTTKQAKSEIHTSSTTGRPSAPMSATTTTTRRSQSAKSPRTTIKSNMSEGSTDQPTEDNTHVRSTAVPNLLSPWQSSNLLNLIKNSPLYNSIQSSVSKSSSQVNWKAANVSLVNAKIVNDTKGRRMGYIPSAWYSEDSDEISRQSTTKFSLTSLDGSSSSAAGTTPASRQTSRSDTALGGGEASTEGVISSSEETPISAEGTVMSTKSRPVDSSSEEVSRVVVLGQGSAKPLLYSSSDEVRSAEVPLWVLTTRKPTHSFGFGHSVVINNHRAPSQNGVKRRRTTTTTRKPTTLSIDNSPSESLLFSSTTPATSNSRFPLEVFDSDDFNTTIVHQNIITIAKPTRPFVIHPTEKYVTQSSPAEGNSHGSSAASPEDPIAEWDESDEDSFSNRIPQESNLAPSRVKAPSTTTPMPHPNPSALTHSHHHKKKQPSKKVSQAESSAVAEATTSKPWVANSEAQYANKPITQVPAILNPIGSVIQLFPNSVFRILQTIGGLVFALPTLLTFGFMAAMLMV
ncbi:endochitinase A-like [Galendromus occidentalis]|uniref:Endochitinase A-like n=1 Tax=Galendromus occidentalis TaxID=34638 RepID=A0AAJ7L5T9_9ACAR|nr:endochitinase A-like [Galendromus occidentalis]